MNVVGIETEGVYRVSGSRVHADALLNKFLSNPSAPLDLYTLDIPIYNVTTALKTFFTEHLPPLVPQSIIDQLHNLACTSPTVLYSYKLPVLTLLSIDRKCIVIFRHH